MCWRKMKNAFTKCNGGFYEHEKDKLWEWLLVLKKIREEFKSLIMQPKKLVLD